MIHPRGCYLAGGQDLSEDSRASLAPHPDRHASAASPSGGDAAWLQCLLLFHPHKCVFPRRHQGESIVGRPIPVHCGPPDAERSTPRRGSGSDCTRLQSASLTARRQGQGPSSPAWPGHSALQRTCEPPPPLDHIPRIAANAIGCLLPSADNYSHRYLTALVSVELPTRLQHRGDERLTAHLRLALEAWMGQQGEQAGCVMCGIVSLSVA